MKIVVLGLGHVGSVTLACLLRQGHVVVGVDTDERTRSLVAHGIPPFHEPNVGELLIAGHSEGRLSVAANIRDHADADMIIICVGTPGSANGRLDISQVKSAAHSVGEVVRVRHQERSPLPLVFRSTMIPGSMTKVVLPAILAAAREDPGPRYEVIYSPEFIREGSAVADYLAPSRIIIGERQPGIAGALSGLYRDIDAPIFRTSFEVAELVKYADNTFHALKVVFANEIGRYALRSHILPNEVFDIFLADTKLNVSSCYLRPGAPFGGACLVKDVAALSAEMHEVGIHAPVVDHILKSNSSHAQFLIAEIERLAAPASRILLVGLAFKTLTDDIRESPFVTIAEGLLDRGYELAIYDPDLIDPTADEGNSMLRFPSNLAELVVPRLPIGTVWDLVIVGKAHSGIAELASPMTAFFHIDRL